jgi:hypothetical protein
LGIYLLLPFYLNGSEEKRQKIFIDVVKPAATVPAELRKGVVYTAVSVLGYVLVVGFAGYLYKIVQPTNFILKELSELLICEEFLN